MKEIFNQIVNVLLPLIFVMVIVSAIVAVTRISLPNKPTIIHSGSLIVTGVEVTDHDSGNFCNYTLSQKDENDKTAKRFSYITRCGMYNAGDHLMLIQGRK